MFFVFFVLPGRFFALPGVVSLLFYLADDGLGRAEKDGSTTKLELTDTRQEVIERQGAGIPALRVKNPGTKKQAACILIII